MNKFTILLSVCAVIFINSNFALCTENKSASRYLQEVPSDIKVNSVDIFHIQDGLKDVISSYYDDLCKRDACNILKRFDPQLYADANHKNLLAGWYLALALENRHQPLRWFVVSYTSLTSIVAAPEYIINAALVDGKNNIIGLYSDRWYKSGSNWFVIPESLRGKTIISPSQDIGEPMDANLNRRVKFEDLFCHP